MCLHDNLLVFKSKTSKESSVPISCTISYHDLVHDVKVVKQVLRLNTQKGESHYDL